MPPPDRRYAPILPHPLAGEGLGVSALLLGTEERRAAGLDDAAHPLGAVAPRTGLALAAVDRPAMLEIAELAIGLHIIPERRPAGLDGLGEHIPDRLCQPRRTHPGDGTGEPTRRQPCPIERLADIDVAEAGHDPLVEQG